MFWCCCAAQPQQIACDSYLTGYSDDFSVLQQATDRGGWLWSVPVGVVPTIEPAGKLRILYDSSQVGTPSSFFRCAQWTSAQTYYRYRMKANWTASGSVQLFGALSGLSVSASFYSNTGGFQTYTAYHFVGYDTGIGWRHKIYTDVNGAIVLVFNGPVIAAAVNPVPQGPFEVDLGMRLERNMLGQWQLFGQWQGADVGLPRTVNAPNNSSEAFSHGFSLQFDLISAVIDSWEYETVQP